VPNVMVRNIPKDAYAVLKQDAKRNHRSLNAEILAILRDKADMARRRARAAEAMKRLDVLQAQIARDYPNQPSSVELIREDRDSR
jgi:plasmid stability protein